MESNNENTGRFKDLAKKYLPVSSLILLTILLMIFFRYKKNDLGRLIESGKNNLISFYAQNLKPLFATTDISNEDVFNFALYQSIPIDKQNNKILTVTNQDADNQVYEIKPSVYNPNTDNYEKFIQYLNLDEQQKEAADSILNSYKKELYVSVLMNDKNTVVVSAKIGELQKAILANLVTFAHEVNAKKANELFQSGYAHNDKNMNNFITTARELPQSEYVFITPDTAFKSICKVDTKDLEAQIESKMKTTGTKGVPPPPPQPPKNWNADFHFDQGDLKDIPKVWKETGTMLHLAKPDSHFFKVVVPMPEIVIAPQINDSVRIHLQKTAEKLRNLSIVWDKRLKNKKNSDERIIDKNKDSGDLEFYFKDPTEIVGKTMEMLSKQNFKNWEDFGEKIDSIAQKFAKSYKDSLLKQNKSFIEKYRNQPKKKSNTSEGGKDTSGIKY